MAILGYRHSVNTIRGQGLNHWLATRGLDGWLDIATQHIDPSARERIAAEIASHYRESVTGHLANGKSEADAQSVALAQLGDSTKASVEFQRTYLTHDEARGIDWMLKTAAKPFFSLSALWMDLVALAFVASMASRPRPDFSFIDGVVLVVYAGFRLIPRLLFVLPVPPRILRRRLAICYVAATTAWLHSLPVAPCLHDQDLWSFVQAFIQFSIIFLPWRPGFMTLQKLRSLDVPTGSHRSVS